jgi:Family of unknown function (DUF6812)
MFDATLLGGEVMQVALTLYTDAFVIRGRIRTRQRRVTDILNLADEPFLVVTDATIDEYGATSAIATRSDFAQVNLATVLFAVSDELIESRPDLRTPKIPEMAMITIPPFRITGRIHLMPERDLHEALSELTGAFIPVTEATYWSDTAGEARATAQLLAFNHNRAHILAPHTEVDPWHGLDRSAAAGGPIQGTADESPARPAHDPWGSPSPETSPEPPGGGWG